MTKDEIIEKLTIQFLLANFQNPKKCLETEVEGMKRLARIAYETLSTQFGVNGG